MTTTPLRAAEPALPDSSLLDRLRRGESAALTETYHRHAAELLALACRLTGSTADAQDIVQDLFVGLPDALARYEERGQFRPWLRRLTVRLALMRLRSTRRRRETDLDAAQNTGPERDTGRGLDVWQGLARLPEEQRCIVILKLVEGYSHEEIAQLLGIRRGTSEVRLHRALTRLRHLLED